MKIRFGPLLLQILTPIVNVGLALLLTLQIKALQERGSLFVFLAAVVVSMRFGGWTAGLAATVLSACVTAFFSVHLSSHIDLLKLEDSADVVRILVFVIISLVILSLHSSRSRAEQDLRRSEQRLILALDSAQMGVWDYNLLTRHFWWSKTLESTYCRTDGSFPNTYGQFFGLIHFDDQPLFNRAITRTIDEGTDYEVNHRIVLADGSHRWVNTRGRVFFNDANRAERIVGITTDISSKRKDDPLPHGGVDPSKLESSVA